MRTQQPNHIQLLEYTKVNTKVCVPAAASIVHKEPHYGLSVEYVVDQAPVKKNHYGEGEGC